MNTRAIHLELVGDMSTDCFILSLRRFLARRGHVNVMQSDNGTNFIGAVKEINDAIKNLKQETITNYLSKYQIKWKFNPPISPWMGGCWESLIKSIKRCLYAILRDRITTIETLTTILCEVEYIINNRPLLPIGYDVNDYEVLTPNNFLLNYKTHEINMGNDIIVDKIDYQQKWKQVQNITNMYWDRWLKEYVPTLTSRSKWTQQTRNLKVGDLVIIKSKFIPRNHWPLGRVTEIFPGQDNVFRSAKVKTPTTELVRPSSSLCLLEASKCV